MELVTNKTLEKLKYDMVRAGLVQYETIEQAEEIADAQNINIGQALINSGILTEEAILKFLEAKLHIPYVNLDDYTLDRNCLNMVSFSDAKKYRIIPLFKIEDTLTVAMADPLDLFAIDKIIETAECSIEPVVSSETSIIKKIDEYYSADSSMGEIYTGENTGYDWREELHSEDLSDSHIQKIIRAILKQAIIEGVHEVTFQGANGEVNFKQNHDIINKGSIPQVLTASFAAKLKSLADLDPSVSEVPQLGKLNFKVDDMNVVASISTFPTIMGERIFLKIYKPPQLLTEIIKNEKALATVRAALDKPGIILVCGSALSGKTHVIYSLLIEAARKNKNKNIMTLESIAKYNLENVNQCELNENVGFNMDKASRFIEFQSPDVVYLEGIKTKESFEYFSSLVFDNKTVIMEFLANNMEDLRNKMSFSDFETLKSTISCMIFIHSQDSIEVFDTETVKKFI